MANAYAAKLRHRLAAQKIAATGDIRGAATYLRGNGYPLEAALVILLSMKYRYTECGCHG